MYWKSAVQCERLIIEPFW